MHRRRDRNLKLKCPFYHFLFSDIYERQLIRIRLKCVCFKFNLILPDQFNSNQLYFKSLYKSIEVVFFTILKIYEQQQIHCMDLANRFATLKFFDTTLDIAIYSPFSYLLNIIIFNIGRFYISL